MERLHSHVKIYSVSVDSFITLTIGYGMIIPSSRKRLVNALMNSCFILYCWENSLLVYGNHN